MNAPVKRYSVPRWTKPALQAAQMSCGPCCCCDTVGIDMVARDGNTFAHGHFDIDVAEKFWRNLGEAIVEARERINPGTAPKP